MAFPTNLRPTASPFTAVLSFAAVLSIAAALVGGCSDAQEEQEVIEGPEITEPTETTEADGARVTAPVIVDSGDPVALRVGEAIDVTTADVSRVESSDTSVLSVTQPSDDGSATFNAGATAEAQGSATLGVYVGDSLAYDVEVTVTAGS